MSAAVEVADLDLPQLDLSDPEWVADPFRMLHAARERHWLARSDLGIVVLSYDACHTLLRDKRTRFATEQGIDQGGELGQAILERSRRNMLHSWGEPHTRMRRLVSRAFTPRAAERVRPFMRRVFDRLLDPVCVRGECDFVAEVSHPYPPMIICELLGTPVEDWEQLSDWVEILFSRLNFNLAEDAAGIVAAQEQMDGYLRDLVERKRVEPGDDLISELIEVEQEGDRLTTEDLATLADNLLTAGTDTTRNQLAAGVVLLAGHRDQRDLLVERPELVPAAVEEILRMRPVVAGTLRHCLEDIELGGVRFPAGTVFAPTFAAANRDPAVYPDPDRFDVTREHAQPVLSFGGGAHYCLGASLARAELQEALALVLRRLRSFEVTGPVEWKPLVGIGGPLAVPLRFEPGG